MKKEWNIVVGVAAAVLIFVTGLIYFGVIQPAHQNLGGDGNEVDSGAEGSRTTRDPSSTDDGRRDDTVSGRDDTVLTDEACATSGGTWNPCGSACRTDPDAICIELCVEYCECKDDLACPSGYTCGDVVENVGVCL